jgi:hypothetical protein
VVADQLHPLGGLLLQVSAHQVEDAGAVRATIHKVTDLDHRQVGR